MSITDILGNEIKIDDYVTYIMDPSNRAKLVISKVLGFEHTGEKKYGKEVIITKMYTLKSNYVGEIDEKVEAKITRTSKTNNILKLHPDMISDHIKYLLK